VLAVLDPLLVAERQVDLALVHLPAMRAFEFDRRIERALARIAAWLVDRLQPVQGVHRRAIKAERAAQPGRCCGRCARFHQKVLATAR
jgi:hypothetical protein